jgi:hypothetical protein
LMRRSWSIMALQFLLMPLSLKREDFESDWRFLSAVYERLLEKAKNHTGGVFDPDAFSRVLRPIEFDVWLVINFDSIWDNNGRFCDTVKYFEEDFDRLDSAFRNLGFNIASVLMPRALEVFSLEAPYWAEDLQIPTDIEAEVSRINRAASEDMSDERLTQAILNHAAEFEV